LDDVAEYGCDMNLRATDHMQLLRAQLIDLIDRNVGTDGVREQITGLRLRRTSSPTEMGHGSSFPSLCVIAQGRKELRMGDGRFPYDPDNYLITTATVPIASRIVEAAPDRPYLGVVLVLDPLIVGSVIVEAGQPVNAGNAPLSVAATSALDAELLDAVVRLVRLVEQPKDARFIAPLVVREVIYRLLTGEQGDRVRQIALLAAESNRISRAITTLREGYDRPIRVDELARDLGMSVSGFHHHFRQVTAMSPMQFQKAIRLQEARRLLVGGELDARQAGEKVGYNDASHFTREYRRFFGEPPTRDRDRLRNAQPDSAA
jgi:AraC-like DNA-binding protein